MECFTLQLFDLTTVLQKKEDSWLSKRCCRDQTEDVHPLHWNMATGKVCMMSTRNKLLCLSCHLFFFSLVTDQNKSRKYIWSLTQCVCDFSGDEHPSPSSQYPRQPEAPFHLGRRHVVLRWRPIHRCEWILSPSIPAFFCSYLLVPLSSQPSQYQACHLPGYSPTNTWLCPY